MRAANSDGLFIFMHTTDKCETELPKCDLCTFAFTPHNPQVKKKQSIEKAKKVTGRNIERLCLTCRTKVNTYADLNIQSLICTADEAILKMQNDIFTEDFMGIYDLLKSAKAINDREIKITLNRLHFLSQTSNDILTKAAEIKNKGVEFLWKTYPERRKRANHCISQIWLRRMIFARDQYKCKICKTGKKLSVDHIKPIALGGTDDVENLQTLCKPCNSRKGATV